MATLRSEFSLEQFDTVLQKYAHEVAVEAVQSLNMESGRIDFRHHGIAYLDTGKFSIRFSGSRISFSRHVKDDYWSFEIEEKLYATSNHRTKISFTVSVKSHFDSKKGPYGEYVEDESRKVAERKRGEEIQKFLDDMLTQNNVKPMPRFSLRTGPAD